MPEFTFLILALLGATCAYELGWERGERSERDRFWHTLHDMLAEPDGADDGAPDRPWEDHYL